MSGSPSPKTTKRGAEKLGRSAATGQFVLKPVHKPGSVRADKMLRIVEKVVSSHDR